MSDYYDSNMKRFLASLKLNKNVNENSSLQKIEPEFIAKEKIVDSNDGLIEYADGSVYRGGIKDSKRSGEGTLILLQESNNEDKLSLTSECLNIWDELTTLNDYNYKWNKILLSASTQEDKDKATDAINQYAKLIDVKINFIFKD